MNRQEFEKEIRAIITRVTEEDAFQVGLDENLADATGLDSLGRLELLSELEEKFGFTIYDLDTDKIATIGGMLEILEKAVLEVV